MSKANKYMKLNTNPLFFSKSVLFHHPQYAKYDKLYYGMHVKNAYYALYDDNCDMYYKYFQGHYPWTKPSLFSFPYKITSHSQAYVLRVKGVQADEITQHISNVKKICQKQQPEEVVCIVYNLNYVECCEWLQSNPQVQISAENIVDRMIVKIEFQSALVSVHRVLPAMIGNYQEFVNLLDKYNIEYCVPKRNSSHLQHVYEYLNKQLQVD